MDVSDTAHMFCTTDEADCANEWPDEDPLSGGSAFRNFKEGSDWSHDPTGKADDDRPEIVRIIEQTVERDNQYRILKGRDREVARQYYTRKQCQYIPFMNPAVQAPGKRFNLRAHDGTLLAHRYERVVVGDHGAYVEVNPTQLSTPIRMMMQHTHGMAMRGAKNTVFHIDPPSLDVYRQDEHVQFADFAVGMYYLKLRHVAFEKVCISPPAPLTQKVVEAVVVKPKLPPVSSGVVKRTPPKKYTRKRRRGQASLDAYFTCGDKKDPPAKQLSE